MPNKSAFASTFDTLKDLLKRADSNLLVTVDKPGDFQVADPVRKDRTGRPLFVAAVQIKKNYVSYHLMGVYASPEVTRTISPALKKRMQGKACFNFTALDPEHGKELAALTKVSVAVMKSVKLPWGG